MTNSRLEFSRTTMTKMSLIKVNVVRKGKREIGFVVRGKYDCYAKIKKPAMGLDKEIQKRKEKLKTVEKHHKNKNLYSMYPVFATKRRVQSVSGV